MSNPRRFQVTKKMLYIRSTFRIHRCEVMSWTRRWCLSRCSKYPSTRSRVLSRGVLSSLSRCSNNSVDAFFSRGAHLSLSRCSNNSVDAFSRTLSRCSLISLVKFRRRVLSSLSRCSLNSLVKFRRRILASNSRGVKSICRPVPYLMNV